MTSLRQLAEVLEAQALLVERRGDAEVTDVSRDSRQVEEGFLFAALPGERRDGARFAAMAAERGASAILLEATSAGDSTLPMLIATDARMAMADVAHAVHGEPTRSLRVAGVTGTNGKTTSTFLISGVLEALGRRSALLGTVEQRIAGTRESTRFTTPESDELARFAHRAKDAGCTDFVMEVSSHGIDQSRVRGVHFDVAAFTNLTQDHLDFHGTMEVYGETKARFFTDFEPSLSVINVCDAFGRELVTRVEASGRDVLCVVPDADDESANAFASSRPHLRVASASFDDACIEAQVEGALGSFVLRSPMMGRHNLENLLVALGTLHGLGVKTQEALAVFEEGVTTPGRLERVEDARGVHVLVDYAHTPGALESALASLKVEGRVIVVFGCGGDRDAAKRPLMGEAAARGADVCFVTSDNPRSEVPSAIIDMIRPGVEQGGKRFGEDAFAIEERRDAIEAALRIARAGDVVLIAGKGHEDYQIVGDERRDFDDRVEAAKAIARIRGEAN